MGEKEKVVNLFEELSFLEKEERKSKGVREKVIEILKRVSKEGCGISIKGIVEEVGVRSEMYVRKVVMELWRNVVYEDSEGRYLVMRRMIRGKYIYWMVELGDKKIDVESWKKERKKVSEEIVRIK